eukprot:1453772-Rhodomonas_salina.3
MATGDSVGCASGDRQEYLLKTADNVSSLSPCSSFCSGRTTPRRYQYRISPQSGGSDPLRAAQSRRRALTCIGSSAARHRRTAPGSSSSSDRSVPDTASEGSGAGTLILLASKSAHSGVRVPQGQTASCETAARPRGARNSAPLSVGRITCCFPAGPATGTNHRQYRIADDTTCSRSVPDIA